MGHDCLDIIDNLITDWFKELGDGNSVSYTVETTTTLQNIERLQHIKMNILEMEANVDEYPDPNNDPEIEFEDDDV